MIYIVISGEPAAGKEEEAIAFSTALAKYVNENYTTHVELCHSITGSMNQYLMVEKCESLMQYAEIQKIQESDEALNALIKTGAGLWLNGERQLIEVM